MKRIIYVLSVLLLLVAVSACGGNDAGPADINDPPPDSDPPVEAVGVWNNSSWDGCIWGQ